MHRFVGAVVIAEHADGETRADVAVTTDEGRKRGHLSLRSRGYEVAVGLGGHAPMTGQAGAKVTDGMAATRGDGRRASREERAEKGEPKTTL